MSSAKQANVPIHYPFSISVIVLLTVALGLGTFMEVLDTSIANVAVPTISGNLGVATSEGTWLISSYALSSAIAVPLTGWLAKRIGEIKLFTFSVIAFSIASLLCGFATNFHTLIAFRLLQGLVSGPMVPLSQTILLRVYPSEKRGLALGLWSMTVIVAPIMGPILGGWLTDNYSWPWIFHINVPVGILCGIIVYIFLKDHETKVFQEKIDVIGLMALIIGVSSLQMMLDFGRDHNWFESTFIISLAVTAAISLIFLVIWELTEKNPIIDLSLFKDRNFTLGCIISSLGFLIFFSSVVIFPLWLQTVMGYTATVAGLATAPTGVLAFFIAPILGANLHRFDLRIVTCFAFLVFAATSFWCGHLTLDISFYEAALPRLFMGIGTACFFIPITAIILSNIPNHKLASAAGLSNFIRTLSGGIGTALSVTYWQNQATVSYSHLVEHVNVYSQNTQAYQAHLSTLGIKGDASYALISNTITQQSYMLSNNAFFNLSAIGFLLLSMIIWITKPINKAATQNHLMH